MKENDEILQQPPKGAGANLVVRFRLCDSGPSRGRFSNRTVLIKEPIRTPKDGAAESQCLQITVRLPCRPCPVLLRRLLPPISHASFTRQGLPRSLSDTAARDRGVIAIPQVRGLHHRYQRLAA